MTWTARVVAPSGQLGTCHDGAGCVLAIASVAQTNSGSSVESIRWHLQLGCADGPGT